MNEIGLPIGWSRTLLGKVTLKLVDGSHNPPKKKSSGYPMLSAINIDGNQILYEPCRLITEKEFDSENSRTKIQSNDILLTIVGAIGRVAVVPKNHRPFALQRSVAVITPALLSPKFLMYQLESPTVVRYFQKNARGTAQKGVYLNTLSDLPLDIPPLNEQIRIVAKIEELFSELDKGIESLKTAREQLKVYRQALLKNAFEGKLTEQWRKENADKLETADQLLERISPPSQPRGGRTASIEVIEGIAALAVNKPNKELPSGWKWTPLLRVARQETGHTPSRNHPEYWNGKEYWIGIVDARLNHGKTITDTLQKITPEGLANSSARTLPKGTVILSRTASVGYVSILGKPMATSQDFVTWSCTDALLPDYLMYAIMAEGDKIRKFGKGTTHTTIYFPEIRALHIALPSIQEQTTITEFLDTKLQGIFHLSGELDAQLEKSEALRQSILKKAFSGKLVPQDPDDEPASVLLERIAAEKAAAAQATAAAKTNKAKRKAA